MALWLVIAPVLGAAVYYTLAPILRKLRRTVARE